MCHPDHTLHNFFGVCGCLVAFPHSVHFYLFIYFGNGLELKTRHDTVPDRWSRHAQQRMKEHIATLLSLNLNEK